MIAPNYCYRCGNVIAILELDEKVNKKIIVFEVASQESRGIPYKKNSTRLLSLDSNSEIVLHLVHYYDHI